ncbi:PREDICTED: uncharacterized protein LOC104815311 isoform X2 [Tarenaya hassleriana]|uniref:uncharacterized protein LOC104815311 isoform X2 n=1 Tax=Tarenaya hassleriana TaxID=28532 RepID=UPI00053C5616|nr:PREDICTED: uncharacterized protein LOC104815311 isoform X2 [Tarenaya hassleriana]
MDSAEEIVNELRDAFGAVATIPAQVLLTGICLQIASSSHSGIREMLEEFLSKWVYEDGHYILNDADASTSFVKGFDGKIFLDVNDYMEVVELYTLTVLGKISEDVDLAISWLEKAALPEERRQELSRRLHSLLSLKTTNISQGSPLLQAKQEASSFVEDPVASKESCDAENKKRLPNEGKNDIYTLLKLSKQHKPSLWSSRPLNLNLGNTQLTISKGKITITLVVFIICYALRRKRVALMRALGRKMGSMKKALLDFWQLAFSYQVNPLAAVQPLPNRRT